MQQPPHAQLTQSEDRVSLAMSTINRNQFKSVQHAAKIYDAAETILRRQRAGISSRRDCIPKSKKLIELENIMARTATAARAAMLARRVTQGGC